jgi:RNA polymerase sigma-70 factor (ECF subfamily)
MPEEILLQSDSLATDAELLRELRLRNGDALLVLYHRYRLRIFALTLRILKNHSQAEEALQDVFQRLWDHPEKFDAAKGPLLAWLLTVARNISLDYKRKESRRAVYHVYPDEASQVEAPRNTVVNLDFETAHSLRQALHTLPAEQRRVLELAYYDGMTHPELAEQLGESLGTVKTRIRLGMQKLKQAFRLEILQ